MHRKGTPAVISDNPMDYVKVESIFHPSDFSQGSRKPKDAPPPKEVTLRVVARMALVPGRGLKL